MCKIIVLNYTIGNIYQWFLIVVYYKSIIVRRSTVFSNWVTNSIFVLYYCFTVTSTERLLQHVLQPQD